jgi:hypothetical protein
MTAHPDHVGFAERARTDAGAQVWIHQADAEAARTGKPGSKNEGSTFSYLLRNAFSTCRVRRGPGRHAPRAHPRARPPRRLPPHCLRTSKTLYLSLASGSGHENGPVLTSLRAVASSMGPAPNDGHHRATPQAPHAGLRA